MTEKIYSFHTKKQNPQPLNETDNNVHTERQVIYPDSSNSSNQTIDTTQESHSDRVTQPLEYSDKQTHKEPSPTKTASNANTSEREVHKPTPLETIELLQTETVYSPASSLIYKTPPSSPQADSISISTRKIAKL